ncbi:MAG: AI-2E family transporter [Pseudomonadota bacterium]
MTRLGRSLAAGPFFLLAFVCLAAWALWASRDHAVPIALAVLVWFLINGMADVARRRVPPIASAPRAFAQTGAALVFFGLLVGAANLVGQSLADLASDLSLADSPLYGRVRAVAAEWGLDLRRARVILLENLNFEEVVGGALEFARGLVSDIALVFLYTLFLLIDERFYEAKLRALVPDEARRLRLQDRLAEISDETRLYLWLMTLVSAGVGLATWAACLAAGVAGAAVWGFLAFGLNYIPTIGSILGVAAPAIFAALTLGDPWALGLLLLALAATQFTAGELVVPRVMGTSLNLSSFVILLTLVLWGALWGAAGMFLAIPITVIAVMVFARFEATRPLAILLSKTGEVPAAEDRAARLSAARKARAERRAKPRAPGPKDRDAA